MPLTHFSFTSLPLLCMKICGPHMGMRNQWGKIAKELAKNETETHFLLPLNNAREVFFQIKITTWQCMGDFQTVSLASVSVSLPAQDSVASLHHTRARERPPRQ